MFFLESSAHPLLQSFFDGFFLPYQHEILSFSPPSFPGLDMRGQNLSSYVLWNFFYDAVNRITNVLLRCDQQWGQDQDDKGSFVVKPENIVVDTNTFKLDETFDVAKDVKHDGNVFLGQKRNKLSD